MSEQGTARADWSLPGMEKFDNRQLGYFKRLILDGDIVNSIHSLGWSYWPTQNKGYLDSACLRDIADFLEIQNKPFWDSYDKWCSENPDRLEPIEDVDFGDQEENLATAVVQQPSVQDG